MRAMRLCSAFGLVLISSQTLATGAQAQDRRAPGIRVTTPLGSSVVSGYVEPAISLTEDAYVFAISVDVNNNIQVLHPEFPGISVKMASERDLSLPSFFAGHAGRQQAMGANRGYVSSYYDGYDPGYSDTRGTVIALASRRAFDLTAVTSGGDWDLIELRRLVGGRDPQSAASALARELGIRGEPIGRDVYRFVGAARSYSSYYGGAYNPYYGSGYYDCGPYQGSLRNYRGGGISFLQANELRRAGYRVDLVGVGACGEPRFAVNTEVAPTRGQRPPAKGAFPRPSTRGQQVPRNPASSRPKPTERGEAGSSGRPTRRYADPARVGRSVPSRETERNPAASSRRPQAARGSFPERPRVVPTQPQQRPRAAEPARRPEPTARTERPARAQPASGAMPRGNRTRPVD